MRSTGYNVKELAQEIYQTQQRLGRAKVAAGDLDGALSTYLELVRNAESCDEQAPPGDACRNLAVRLSWTADVYAATDRPNLGEPEKAVPLYERALAIQQRITVLDAHDQKSHFDLAARYGKLGDSMWRSDPKRALDLYERALATAQTLVSREQVDILKDSHLIAISRPLIQLGRTAEARRALIELQRKEASEPPSTAYADRLGDISVHMLWPHLLAAEGKRAEARLALEKLIQEIEALRAAHPEDLTPIFFLSACYRHLASIAIGQERREALGRSAAAWHSWPATTFTRREEQKDLAAANQSLDPTARP